MNWNLLHRFTDNVNETASGAQVTENFDQAREKIEALENVGALGAAGVRGLFATHTYQAAVGGATTVHSETDEGINFSTACDFAWIAGWETFSDAGFTTPNPTAEFNAFVAPNGKHVTVSFQATAGNTFPFYARVYVVAMGH